MGTRNLTCIIKDGLFRVAQYGQWDGYPSGAGAYILNFLNNQDNIQLLENALERVKFYADGELEQKLDKAGMNCGIVVGSEQEREYQKQFFWTDRDLRYKILDALINRDDPIIMLDNQLDFAGDSLFCEWAYVIDLDQMTLGIYKGFNEDPKADNGVFSGIVPTDDEGRYQTVALVKNYPLDDLPNPETFVEECDPPEGD
jgi:hypothetical protein